MLFLTSSSLSLALILFVVTTPAAAASDGAQPPALRASVPDHVAAPRTESRPARVTPDRASTTHTPGNSAAEKVNINTADVKTLMTLSGVTRKVAQQIVAYRDEHGAFKRASELRKIDGVGDAVWEKNRRRIVTK